VVIIHIYVEKSQGKSQCGYLYLKKAKMSFLFFAFIYKIREQGEEHVLLGVGGMLILVGGEVVRKRVEG
jgi:hypothetical protein